MQPKSNNGFTYEITTETATIVKIEKWHQIWFRFFHKFLTADADPGPKEERNILPESTPARRICGHLCYTV